MSFFFNQGEAIPRIPPQFEPFIYIYISGVHCYGTKSAPFIITKKLSLILVHPSRSHKDMVLSIKLSALHNESLIYIVSTNLL